MAFEITITETLPDGTEVVEKITVSRQAFVMPAMAKLAQQEKHGHKYQYSTTEVSDVQHS